MNLIVRFYRYIDSIKSPVCKRTSFFVGKVFNDGLAEVSEGEQYRILYTEIKTWKLTSYTKKLKV